MTFQNLTNDSDCNCLEGAQADHHRCFARKINKPLPLEKDFESHWEKAKRKEFAETQWEESERERFEWQWRESKKDENCYDVCGKKGISINLWDEALRQETIDYFATTFKITPKHKDSLLVLKFKAEAGVTKHTPLENNGQHYDFYKDDNFSLLCCETVEIINLKDCIK